MVPLVFDEQALPNLLDHGTVTRFACSKGPNYELLAVIPSYYGYHNDGDIVRNDGRMTRQCPTEDKPGCAVLHDSNYDVAIDSLAKLSHIPEDLQAHRQQ
jgi:hypothetical protein